MIVLDTHALIWWVSDDPALSEAAKQAIEQELLNGDVVISAISAWEIALLVERGRLSLSMDVSTWLSMVEQIDGVHFMPVDVEISVKSTHLPGEFHKDPADRMIVATARKLAVPLISKDEKIRNYAHVKTIW